MKNKLLNTRNLFIAVVLAGTAFLTTSCKKYLSPAPISTFDPSIAFSNLPNAKAALLGAYMSLAGDYGYGIRASVYYPYDDDCFMGGGAGLDQARHQEAHYTIQAGNADIVNTFNQFYAGIERANLCIYYIPQMPQYTTGAAADKTELQRMLGEALILRAQFYFEIVRIWGDVPAQWIPSAFVSNLFLNQTPRDTIYNHLLDDLGTASGLMAWRTQASSQDERFTKGTAMALRAKIAMFRGGYSLRHDGTMQRTSDYLTYYKLAKSQCDSLIARRDQHTLLASYQSLWKDVIDAHKAIDASGELMMQVAMANGTNSDSKLGCQDGTKINGVGGALGILLPTYFYQFDSTDLRRDVTCVPFEVVQDNYGRGHAINSLYDGKFRRDWVSNPSYYMSSGVTTGTSPVTLTPASNASIQNMQIKWPLIRFADVLLMDAEADNEINGAPSANAISYFKEVSLRGHGGNTALLPTVPTDHDGFFKLLVRERSLEFGTEGIRKYDLIRWNLLGTAIAETKANLAILALKTPTNMNQLSYQAPQPTYTLGANLPDSLFSMYSATSIGTSALPSATFNLQPAPTTSTVFTSSYYAKATNTVALSAYYTQLLNQGPLKTTTTTNTATTTTTPFGFKVLWRGNAAITTSFVNYYGYGFVAGHSELYPFPQASIDANPNLRPQNPGY